MVKNWRDGPRVTTDLFSHVVSRRKIDNLDTFLEPRFPDDLHDPFRLTDMDQAVKRFWHAIEADEPIGIVGDYDMDGTPGAALLSLFINLVAKPPHVILPTREEGYGFSPLFVDRLHVKNVKLIITVDCGIRNNDTVTYASSKGIDAIIIDHHECGAELPAASAVINPKRPHSDYPFKELCGTGVVYKFITAAIAVAPKSKQSDIPANWLPWSLDLVALATIGDMVPLIDENRLLVHYGLKVLQKTRRLGLQRLFSALELDMSRISYSDIVFKIIPKCNASGRMHSMDDVFILLQSNDINEIDRAIKQIMSRGTQSQLILTKMMEQAKGLQSESSGSIVLITGDDWHPGLTGVVAGRLTEEWGRPVGVLAKVTDDTYRGSIRSIPGVNIPDLLDSASDLIEAYGGHDQAAGLTVQKDKVATLQKFLSTAPIPDGPATLIETEGTISPEILSVETLEALERLMPWGIGNPEPLWSLTGTTITRSQWLSDGRHLKAWLGDRVASLSVIFFGADTKHPPTEGVVDVYGTLSINEFRNQREPQMIVKGMSSAQSLQMI
jgi:single-stranded-DNA-specific exonuclease